MSQTIRSLGVEHDLRVDPTTGSLTATLPLRTSRGRGGFGPQLYLSYQSTGGNGPFGVGWRLSGLLSVSVDTTHGVPRYDGHDRYTSSATGELVPIATSDAQDARDHWSDAGAYAVRRFRSRVESGYQRVEQWVEKTTRASHWVTRDARGVVTTYGLAADGLSRIADPDDPHKVFQWLPELQIDPQGNAIRFDYAGEDLRNVDRSASNEAARLRTAGAPPQRYVKRIRWGNTLPMTAGMPAPAAQRWCFEAVFDYGDHDHAAPLPEPDAVWPGRVDPSSTCLPGFDLRTYRRCRRVLVYHRFPALHSGPVLITSYELQYDERPEGATLLAIKETGHRREPDGSTPSKARPLLRFEYSRPRVASAFHRAPTETMETLPNGLDGPRYRWMDLYGEGLPGILIETPNAWSYRRNEGGGRFGADTVVVERPAYQLSRAVMQDLDGDGNPDLAIVGSRGAGYYELDRETDRWRGFRPFPSVPHLDSVNARVQWLDLDGDGRPELLLGGPDRLTWFRSSGKDGFEAGIELQPVESNPGAPVALLREDPLLDYFFADMNGDGLADQVLVRNGFVAYWPNLGNGRFGSIVVMDDAPRFAPEDDFDTSRLLFADLDGSGTADLLYVGHGEITFWTNAAGNRFLAGQVRGGLPFIDNLSSVRVLDFLVNGTPCLVWSASTTATEAGLQYLPLTDGVRAGLLVSCDNGLGLVRQIEYGTSATHYVNDRMRGTPWRTRLASHVVVVERVEARDEIGGSRSVRRYAYHDGCYDEKNRRFIGFGCNDVFDTEMADDLGRDPGAPPSVTRSFLHLGIEGDVALARAWRGDAAAPVVPVHAFEGTAPLSGTEAADALAAVAGRVVRQEVFAIEPGGRPAAHPYHVEQTGFLLRRLQPETKARRTVVTAIEREHLTTVYEQAPDDPRVLHRLLLDTDMYGVTRLACSIAYPRRSTATAVDPAQQLTTATVERTRVTHIDDGEAFQPSIGVEREEFDLPGMTPPVDGVYTWSAVRAYVTGALAAPVPHDAAATPHNGARRTSWSRTYYYDASGTNAAPFGSVALPPRLHHVEEAAFSTTFPVGIYGAQVGITDLANEGMYREDAGHWWRRGETVSYGGRAVFYRVEGVTRTDTGTTRIGYDPYSLVAIETTDAANNSVRVTPDYHLLAPARSIDENNHVSEIAYDPLGVPVFVTRRGDALDDTGTLRAHGFDLLASIAGRSAATPESAIADPAAHLQGAAEATVYDVDRWTTAGEPPLIVRLVREMPVSDGTGQLVPDGHVLVTVTHLDGFGRTLQEKAHVEGGLAVTRDATGRVAIDTAGRPVLAEAPERWRTGGHTVFNPRQQPARQYEPFFSTTWRFESDRELATFGAAHAFQYDALGRELRRDHPDGTHERKEYGAWSSSSFDANDTVDDSAYRTEREQLPAGHPERDALEQSRAHARTPVVMHVDPEGREVLRTESSGDGQTRSIRTTYGPAGEIDRVRDARGLEAMRVTRDMLGRPVRTESIDAGWQLVFYDGLDRPRRTWDAAGVRLTRTFDRLDRPISIDADGLPGLNRRVHDVLYGDDPSVTDAVRRNARGRLVRSRDESGEQTVERYAPGGEILGSTIRLAADPEHPPDWRTAGAAALLPGSFASHAVYDGLGRIRRQTRPDGSTLQHRYDRSGGLRATTLSTADGLVNNVTIFDAGALNARAQRERLRLGNGVTVVHTFDPITWRTTRILASRPAGTGATTLQDLEYTYDPVGNVVRSLDRVQQPGAVGSYITGLNVPAVRTFTYDGFYQLRQATGRVHRAMLADDHRTSPANPGTIRGARRLSLNDGGQLERYTQTFTYDVAGNIERIRHQGTAVNWTQDHWVSPSSNRSLTALDANGIAVVNPETYFDAVGNCVRLPHLRAMEWDYRRMPRRAVIVDRSAAGQPSDIELYVHDASGSRVRRQTRRRVGGGAIETTDVLYFGDCEIRRVSRGATPLLERRTTRVQDGFSHVAAVHRWTLDSTARETTDVTRARFQYQLSDHLGSGVVQLDALGRVVAFEEHMPYGSTALLAGNNVREVATRDYRFCGKERDDATALHYFGHRYYASWLGRWLSPDPAGPVDGLNLYQYALNNPISNSDPDGLQTTPRGSRREVEQQIPADVHAAFNKLPADQQDKVRKGIEWTWFYDAEKKQTYFGPRAQMEALAEASIRQGKNVGEVVAPGPPKKKEKPPPKGPRAGEGAPSSSSAKGTPGSRGAPKADGAGGGGTAGAQGRAGVQPPSGEGATSGSLGPNGDPTASTESDLSRVRKNPSANSGDGTIPGGGGNGQDAGSGGTPRVAGSDVIGDGPDGGRSPDTGVDDGTQAGGEEGPDQGGQGQRAGTGDQPGMPNGQPRGEFAGGTGGTPDGRLDGLPDGTPQGKLRRESGTGTDPAAPGNTPTPTGDANGSRGRADSGPGGGASRQRENPQQGGARDGSGQKKTVMDRVTKVAGWWHLQFGDGKDGESGGIPGGSGTVNIGAWGQALFVALTVAEIIFTVLSLGGLAAIKSVLRSLMATARAALALLRGRIAALWARRAALQQGLRAIASRGWSLLKEWWFFRRDLGGATNGLGYGPFRLWMRTAIQNTDRAAGRMIAAADTAFHEGFHALMAKVPFWWAATEARLAGRPIGAGLMWAEEAVAYAVGHLRVLRLHAIPFAPLEAFGSVFANFGKGAAGAQAVRWAIGEIVIAGAGAAAYFGLREDDPEPVPAGGP
ncbi:MAG: hypothetical protein HOP16_16420 [Acidobacteria bacterium]|nr:hypothetical protein [Acidobacteriota bacterium]